MEYQKNKRYFAQIAGSLEKIAAAELEELGAKQVQSVYRGASFFADKKTLYEILYQTRLSTRLLAPLISFKCHDEKYLYATAVKFNWDEILKENESFGIITNTANSRINNSLYAGQRLKDAICDYFRDKTGKRPDYDQKNPDLRLNLHIKDNWVNISLDLGGQPLHKRGYRQVSVSAPLQETLAAALVRYSLWQGETPFYDPFCGSGTILTEAMMHYCKIPAGYLRTRWGIEKLPDFEAELWKEIKQKANSEIRDLPEGLIAGSDLLPRNVSIARKNLNSFEQGKNVKITTSDFRKLPNIENQIIVGNPPYGKRLDKEEITGFLNDLGDFFKQKCAGSTAFVLVGDKEYSRALRLRTRMDKLVKNGDIESRLLRIDLYKK